MAAAFASLSILGAMGLVNTTLVWEFLQLAIGACLARGATHCTSAYLLLIEGSFGVTDLTLGGPVLTLVYLVSGGLSLLATRYLQLHTREAKT